MHQALLLKPYLLFYQKNKEFEMHVEHAENVLSLHVLTSPQGSFYNKTYAIA